MNFIDFFSRDPWLAALSGLAGAVLTILVQAWRARRGVFTYGVVHSRIGISSDDPLYGSVRLTWNDEPTSNLFFSVVELTNESPHDYEDVIVRLFSRDTTLLTESAGLKDSIKPIPHSDEYRQETAVPMGAVPTPEQFAIHGSRREYLVPTFNRGQVARFSVLNAARTDAGPSIWLDVQHTGVVCRFKEPRMQILGVPRGMAVTAGSVSGLAIVLVLVRTIDNTALIAFLSFLVGWLVLLPGIGLVRAFRKLRELLVG